MTSEQASTIFQFLLPQVKMETDTTRRVLAAVPNDTGDYNPSGKCKSCIELVSHIARTDVWFLRSVIKGEFASEPMENFATPSEALAYYDAEIPKVLAELEDLTGEHLAKSVQFYSWNFPNIAYVQLMMKHGVHHRGQLSAYLRPMGAKVPSIYGSSADDVVTAAASQ